MLVCAKCQGLDIMCACLQCFLVRIGIVVTAAKTRMVGTARNEKTAGSGLGLAIVSRAVRNMGGRIIAKNLQPQGLLLEIQLPRLEQEV